MIISNITPPQVWSASARSLTNIGIGALTAAQTVFTSVAASASVDLRVAAGQVEQTTIAVVTGAGATAAMVIQLWDGASIIQVAITAAAANSGTGFSGNNNNSVGFRILNNDAAVAGRYLQTSLIWTP